MVGGFPGIEIVLSFCLVLISLQEDPFKLVVLSKSRHSGSVTNADFFFGGDGQLSYLVADEEGIVRTFEYNPRR